MRALAIFHSSPEAVCSHGGEDITEDITEDEVGARVNYVAKLKTGEIVHWGTLERVCNGPIV